MQGKQAKRDEIVHRYIEELFEKFDAAGHSLSFVFKLRV